MEAIAREAFGAIPGEPVFPFTLGFAQDRVAYYCKLTERYSDDYKGPKIIDEPLPRLTEDVIKENFIRAYHEEKNRKDAEARESAASQRRLLGSGSTEDDVSTVLPANEEGIPQDEPEGSFQVAEGEHPLDVRFGFDGE